MSNFSEEASIQSDLPVSLLWPGDFRYATDSPTLTAHHQNLQVSCKFKRPSIFHRFTAAGLAENTVFTG